MGLGGGVARPDVEGVVEHHAGLELRQVRVPFGVVGMIYEARPNVTVDIAGLALKSAWHQVQLGGQQSTEKASRGMSRLKEKYEVIQKISGERRIAKRVDYR